MKKITLLPLCVLIFLLSMGQVLAEVTTYRIKGNIVDHATKKSIEQANVFLSKTTFNTTSDKSGEYVMNNILSGNYDMVFHAEGYEKLVVNINVSGSEVIEIDAFLLKESIEENEVISSNKIYDDVWRQNLQQFSTIFLGSGPNAENSEILNPDVLSFDIDEQNHLTVAADDELQIINHALGYELIVTIQSFSWDLDNDTGHFLNLIQMNELKADMPGDLSNWATNRVKTFDESLRKFLYTLTQDSPKAGFAYTYSAYDNPSNNTGNGLYSASSSIFSSYAVKARGPQSGRFIKVTYHEVVHSTFPKMDVTNIHLFEIRSNYRNIAVLPDYRPGTNWRPFIPEWNTHKGYIPTPESVRLSYIGHANDTDTDRYIAVDSYGNLLNPLEVLVSGYWAKKRIADFLPHNYQPVKINYAAM